MPIDLKNALAIITGGSSGVGLECARQLLQAGANVVITGSNNTKLGEALADLDSPCAQGLAGDVRDSRAASAVFDFAEKSFGQSPTLLINCAGTILREPAQHTNDADWQFVFDVNVNGTFYFSREFVQRQCGPGAIVNVSSTCGQVGAAGLAAYCASKGAVDQLTRAMALELAEQKITVNAVAPGAINSPMLYSNHTQGVKNKEVMEANMANIPLGSIAEPAEVARAILFLARERHITGTILSIDGGYTAA